MKGNKTISTSHKRKMFATSDEKLDLPFFIFLVASFPFVSYFQSVNTLVKG